MEDASSPSCSTGVKSIDSWLMTADHFMHFMLALTSWYHLTMRAMGCVKTDRYKSVVLVATVATRWFRPETILKRALVKRKPPQLCAPNSDASHSVYLFSFSTLGWLLLFTAGRLNCSRCKRNAVHSWRALFLEAVNLLLFQLYLYVS